SAMRFSEKVAFLVTERRGLMWSAVVLIAIISVAILMAFLRLDTEVLNLLPRGFDSVEGLKIYNSEFAQTRELTFALLCQPEDVDKLEEFAPKFAEKLRAQPWCVRVLAGSPMETPDGVRDLQRIALALLLNLEPEDFDRAISLLQPQKIQERLGQLRREIESGSPRPEIALVGAVFFIGFRRWLPLLGMGFALLLCCLIGLAAGLLIFHRLNMLTVGFCAILVGLGVDFAILIYGRYQQARNEGDGHRVAV